MNASASGTVTAKTVHGTRPGQVAPRSAAGTGTPWDMAREFGRRVQVIHWHPTPLAPDPPTPPARGRLRRTRTCSTCTSQTLGVVRSSFRELRLQLTLSRAWSEQTKQTKYCRLIAQAHTCICHQGLNASIPAVFYVLG